MSASKGGLGSEIFRTQRLENANFCDSSQTTHEMTEPAEVDLDEVYRFAIWLGKESGSRLLQAAQDRFAGGRQSSHLEKESAVDIVTQTDEGEF